LLCGAFVRYVAVVVGGELGYRLESRLRFTYFLLKALKSITEPVYTMYFYYTRRQSDPLVE
jgi:hypothetical protein